jgi:hypothetical protein
MPGLPTQYCHGAQHNENKNTLASNLRLQDRQYAWKKNEVYFGFKSGDKNVCSTVGIVWGSFHVSGAQ